MRGEDRRARGDDGAVEGFVGDVRDVDHHAEAIHLVDDVFAEVGEAILGVLDVGIVDVAGGVGPVVGVGPGEGHVADAEAVVVAQEAERIFDGVAAFDAHERGELVFAMGALDVFGGIRHHHLVGMFGGLLQDGVDEVEGAAGVVAFVEFGLDPDGEEFRAEVALLRGGEVEIAAVEGLGEVVMVVEHALRGVGVGVDDDGGVMHGGRIGGSGFVGHRLSRGG